PALRTRLAGHLSSHRCCLYHLFCRPWRGDRCARAHPPGHPAHRSASVRWGRHRDRRCRRPCRSRADRTLPDAAALMTRITASNLRDRVSLEKQEEIDDGYGGVTGQWVVQFERDACILLSKGGETVIASRLQSIQPALIIVRFDAETSTITADWRLIETRSGTTYN